MWKNNTATVLFFAIYLMFVVKTTDIVVLNITAEILRIVLERPVKIFTYKINQFIIIL